MGILIPAFPFRRGGKLEKYGVCFAPASLQMPQCVLYCGGGLRDGSRGRKRTVFHVVWKLYRHILLKIPNAPGNPAKACVT